MVLFTAPTVVLAPIELTEKFLQKAPVLLKTQVGLILLQRAAQNLSLKLFRPNRKMWKLLAEEF